MLNSPQALLFFVLITLVCSRPFCHDCSYYPFYHHPHSCPWGCPPPMQLPKMVLVCPASRTAINCGMLPEAQGCTLDDDCGYGQKCCEDGCFKEPICKQGFYVVQRRLRYNSKVERSNTTEHPEMEEVTAT